MISLQAFDPTMASNRKMTNIESAIHLVRGQRVMLDSDLAAIYGVTTKRLNEQLRRYRPWAFTEHGALMLASVLNSEVAVQASVRVVRAFVKLREMVAANVQLAAKLEELERRLDSHDEAIVGLFATLKRLLEPPEPPKRREIGFHVREKAGRYRAQRTSKTNGRNSRLS